MPNLIVWRCIIAISVGDAVLKLGVDTKALDKGMKGIGATIKKHQKAIGIGMVAAGGAILAAGVLSIKTFAEMGDEVQKLALKTGFSTESLSEWRHAAEISGASIQTLEKGVKRMSTSIIDAQDGLLESVRNFDKLGMSVEDLQGLSPEEQFEKIAFALAKIEDPTLRAAIAQKIFGRAGTELLPLLAAGEEGIAALREEAHDLGIVFDQEAADKAAKFNDEMHRVDEAAMGFKMVIAEQLLPILIPLIEKISATVKGFTKWAEEHPTLTKVIILGATALGGLLVVLGSLLLILPGISAAMTMFGGATLFALGPIGLIIAAIIALIAIGVVLVRHWDTISSDAVRLWNHIKGVFVGIGEVMWQPIKKAVDFIVGYIQSVVNAISALWNFVLRITGRGGGGGGGGGGRIGMSAGMREAELEESEAWAREASPGRGAFGTGGGFTSSLATGGIAMRPMLARVAEREPEAVIPLSRLGALGGRLVNIFIELDGETIGRAIGAPLVNEIRLKTGVHI